MNRRNIITIDLPVDMFGYHTRIPRKKKKHLKKFIIQKAVKDALRTLRDAET